MKRKLFYLVCCLHACIIATSVSAQNASDSVRILEYLPVRQTDHIRWIKRYQADIDRYVDVNRKLTDFSCDALFIGSSSINLWENISNDLAPLKIIKRSYGGAALRDMLYNYDVIVRGYQPKMIVMYVENDFCSCDENISVGEAYDLFRVFVQKAQHDYPGVPFFILSMKPSPSRMQLLTQQLALNELLYDYCRRTPGVHYIDVASSMYDREGKLRSDIFQTDNLHLNQKGYYLWASVMKPILLKALPKQ